MRKIFLLLISVVFSFFANAQLTGTKNIPGDYGTLALAINDLNVQGVGAGGVTLNLLAGNPETAPVGGFVIGGTGSVVLTTSSAANPITITGNSNVITASGALGAGVITDAIFKLIGADYITIQGFTMQENAGNTTTAIATNNMTEWGVALLYVTTTDGAQNNTIQNNAISLNRAYSNTFGIYSNTRHTAILATTAADATTAGGANSGNKVYNNTISNVDKGITFVGAGTPVAMDNGNDIGGTAAGTGNTITNWGGLVSGAASLYISIVTSSYCIVMNDQINDNVSYNTVTSATNITTLTTTAIAGIIKVQSFQPTGLTFSSNYNNNTVTMSNAATTAQMTGIGLQGLTTLSTATYNCNNNNIINCANTGAGVLASTMIGMLHSSAPGTFNINGNTIRGFTTTTTTTGGFIGIQQQTNGVVNVLNINNNKIGDATAGAVTFSNTNSASVSGIVVTSTGAAATCTMSLNGNDFRGIVYTTSGSGTHTYVSTAAAVASCTIGSNTFTNLNVNTTGTVTFISHGYSIPTTGLLIIDNNSIITAFNRGGASGSVLLTTSNSTSGTGSINNYTNNNFSNITVAGTTTITGFNNTDGGTGSTKTITGNTFNNWTAITGAINTMNFTYWNGVSSLSNNTVTNITGQSTVTGITIGSTSNAATSIAVANNTITNLTSTGAGGAVTGITCSNSSALINVNNNAISTLASSGAAAVTGISIGGATTTNVFKNKICDIAGTNASSTVNGILVSAGTTVSVYNNLVGDLRTPAANAANPLVGLNITGGTTVNAYYNTVRIAGTSTGALFGSSAVSVSTTPNITLRNNIFVNAGTTTGAAFTAAYRRSTTTLTTYNAASNNNLFYAGTPGATNVIYYDGTNNDQTLTAYKSRVSARDASSVTENPPFLSTTCANANFLHIDPSIGTQVESGAVPVSGITDDFDGNTRNASTPDIGADEFAGIAIDLTGPSITYAILGNTSCVTDRILTPVTTTDASGINIAPGTRPRLYYKKSTNANTFVDNTNATDGWKFVEATGAGGSPFSFTTDYSLLFGGAPVVTNIIQYFVVAQDNAGTPNIGINSGSFAAAPISVALTAAAFPLTGTINSYTLITAGLTGTVTIGAAGTYTSLTGATGLFNAINTNGLSGNLTANIMDASVSETGAIALNAINYNGCAAGPYTLLIKPNTTSTLTGNVGTGSIIKLNGADFVTIDGSNSGGTDRNLTLENTTTTTTGNAVVWLASPAIGNGSVNNTIKNCTIQGNAATTTFAGIHIGGSTTIGLVTAGTELNSNNAINNNLFRKTQYGVTLFGWAATSPDLNNTITNNNFGTAIAGEGFSQAAINTDRQQNLIVSGNEVQNVTIGGANTGNYFGIRLLDFKNGQAFNNKVHDISYTGTSTGKVYGIAVSSSTYATAGNPSNALFYNNIVYKINSTGTSATWNTTGILAGQGYGDKYYFNSVHLTGQLANSSSGLAAAFANGDGNLTTVCTNIDVRNNVYSLQGSSSIAGGNFWAYYTAATTLAGSTLNYNDLFCNGTNATNNVGRFNGVNYTALGTWQTATGQEANSITGDPLMPAPNILQPLTGSPLVNAATPIAGITTDITALIRNITTPTMGAYELAGDFYGPSITYTNLVNSLCLTDRTISPATITDVSGVNILAGTRPRLYFKKSTDANTFNDNTNGTAGWKYVEATGAGGSPFSFTTNYSLLFGGGGAVSGDIIQYFVVAQDNIPNVSINNGTFNATPVSVALTAAAFPITGSINSYSLLAGGIGTDKTIGAAGDYTSLTGAGGLFAAINAGGLTNNITVRILDATVAETGANALNAVSYGCAGTYTLTIVPNTGVTATLTGSVASGALIKLNGAGNVTIDGSNSGGTDRSLTIRNTSAINPAAVWIGSTGAGTSNNTVKNCNISTGINTATSYGIAVSNATTIGNGGADNDNVSITNNNITQAYYGIFANGTASVSAGGMDNLVINGNTIGPVSAGATNIGFIGVNIANAVSPALIQNTVQNLSATAAGAGGIITAATVNGVSVDRNTVQSLASTTAALYGIQVNGLAGSTVSITRNIISGVNGNTSSSASTQVFGLQATVSSTIDRNKIDNVFNNHTGTWGAIGLDANGGNGFIIKNNFVSNVNENIAGGGAFSTTFGVIGIRLSTGTGHQVYHNSVNLYGAFTGSASSILSAAFAIVSTTSTGCDVRNNIFSNTLTGGTTSIANVSMFLPSAATSAMNLILNNNAYYTGTTAGVHGIAHCGTTYTSPVTAIGVGLFTAANFNSGATTPVTNLRNYTSTLLVANTNNDNASYGFTSAAPFTSNTDLHIPNATSGQLESGGASAVGLLYDIDNEVRPGPTNVNGGGTAPDIGADEFDGTPASNMIYVSSTTTQTNVTGVGVGTSNQHVIGIQIVTAGTLSPINATSFTINTNGTSAPATDITNAKLWYTGTTNTFATTTQVGATVPAPSGSFNITGTQTLSAGTNYFWLTYDIPCTAVITNVIDAECNSLTVVSPQIPTLQAPVGTRTIISGGLSGTVTIGAAGTYTSLTGATGLFAAINSSGLSGNLIANILDASVAETGATALNGVNYLCGGGPYTITIKPNAAVVTILTGSVATGAVIKLNGADNVIIDGSNSGGTDRSMTIENTNTSASGNAVIWLASPAIGNGANTNTIKNCIIQGNGALTTFTGLHIGGSTAIGLTTAGLELNSSNIINNNLFRKSQYGATLFGWAAATPDLNNAITNNNFGTAVAGEGFSQIALNADRQQNLVVSGNEVQNVTNATTANTFVGGMRLLDFKNGLCYNNKIHDLSYTGTSTPKYYGIGVASSTYTTAGNPSNAQIYNNIVYKMNSTGTSAVWNLTGISANAGYGDRYYYNTVHLTGQLANSSSGLVAAFANGDGNNTTSCTNIDVRNNVFSLQGSSATAGGNFWAYYSAATTVAGSALNYNDLYCNGTGATNNVGRFNAINYATLGTWQTATGMEANSIAADPLLPTPTVLQPSPGTPLLNAATPIAGITTDITGFTRNVTTPTIGAYEQAGDFSGPTITYVPLSNTLCITDRTLSPVTITDVSGVNTTAGTRPRLYYRKSTDANTFNDNTNATVGWKYVEATGAGGSPFSFTTNFALLNSAPVVAGDVIQYFVVAQDNATPNVSINSGTFTANPTSVALTAAAFPVTGSINSYTNVSGGIGTDKTIGAAGDYTSLTGAGGLFAAINSGGLTNNITVRILDATVAESGANALNAINYGCGGPYNLIIKPNTGVTATLTGSVSSGALIKLNGASNVTIDGSNNGTNSRDLTITNTSATSPTVLLAGSAGTTAFTNVTVKNSIMINGTISSSAVVVSDATAAGSPGYFNNITLQNNSVQKAYIGVYCNAVVSAGNGSGLNITTNDLNTSGANAIAFTGIYVQGADGATVQKNNIGNFDGTSSEDDKGIWFAAGTINSTVTGNTISNLNYSGTGGYGGHGIFVSTGNAAANVQVSNNMIANVSGDGWNYTSIPTDNPIGIAISGTQGGVKVYFNSINMYGNTLNQTSAMAMGIYLGTGSVADVRNNIIVNNQGLLGATGYGTVGIYAATANTQFTNIDYNDYFVNPTGTGAKYIGQISAAGALTFANWQTATAQDVNSLNMAPVFVSNTDLHLVPASNCTLKGKGTPIAGITLDIDGDTRSLTIPDIGADEFAAPGGGVITWTGAINTDWNNPGNWGCGGVPTITSEVVIPNGVPNYPVINLNVTIKKLTVSPGASFTVTPPYDFKITG